MLFIASQVTYGSIIGAGYSINGVIKRIFSADFCDELTNINRTCPLQQGS